MLRFLLGMTWAIATIACAGIGLGSLFGAMSPAGFGSTTNPFAGAFAGAFLTLAWILYRLGSKRFLPWGLSTRRGTRARPGEPGRRR